jgi:hypothetical protein
MNNLNNYKKECLENYDRLVRNDSNLIIFNENAISRYEKYLKKTG